jgi:hypothetical protein
MKQAKSFGGALQSDEIGYGQGKQVEHGHAATTRLDGRSPSQRG